VKKIIAFILMAVMCVGLAACGEATPNSNGDAAANKKEYKAVEIDMNNWSEYFEFTTNYSVYYEKSAFSDAPKEVSAVAQDFYFSVKDEYFSRLDTVNSKVTVRISTEFGAQKGTFAADYSSFEPNGEFTSDIKDMIMESMDGDFRVTDHGKFAYQLSSAAATLSELSKGELFKWLKNQKVLNIMGTLYIAE
jgi:hypothetical protein